MAQGATGFFRDLAQTAHLCSQFQSVDIPKSARAVIRRSLKDHHDHGLRLFFEHSAVGEGCWKLLGIVLQCG